MKYYIEAYYKDGTQILGNMDGQTVLNCVNPLKTDWVKRLKTTGRYKDHVISRKPYSFKLVTNDNKVLSSWINPNYSN